MGQAEELTIEFIKLPAVKALTGLGTTNIYEMAKAGTFPRQVPLAGRSVAWVRSEVLAWNRAQVNAARKAKSHDPIASEHAVLRSNRSSELDNN
ncbi:AlpA family phage regulatory protein [Pseudomonas alliivorans]|nr:AlpA family phage regulatory protein [Pseudomonas alliivorans]